MGVIPNRLIQDLFNYGKSQLHIGHSCGIYPFQFLLQPAENRSFGSAAESARLPPEFKNPTELTSPARVAHLRKNFNTAADYYIKALNEDPDNQDLLSRVYVILASKGRIAEAARYAEIISAKRR